MKIIEIFRFGSDRNVRRDILRVYRTRLLFVVNIALVMLGIVAVCSLVMEYGFYLTDEWAVVLAVARTVVLYGFALQAFVKILLAEDWKTHVRKRWGELVIFGIIVLSLLAPEVVTLFLFSLDPHLTPEAVTQIYVIVTQTFVLLAILPSTLRTSRRLMAISLQPSSLLALSFMLLILVGTGLLMLPKATVAGSMSFVDALFTATSAVTTTGLIVVDTGTFFTRLGQGLIVVLLQLGGLGIMTFTTFFAFVLGSGPRLKEYATLQSLLEEENLGKIRRTVLMIVVLTLIVEAAGTALLFSFIPADVGLTHDERWFFSVFHSISAFCTGGFSLLRESLAHPSFQVNIGFMGTICFLMIAGSLGFPVFFDFARAILARVKGQPWRTRLSVHTKIVVICTIALYGAGSGFFYLLEGSNSIDGMRTSEKILTSMFQTITASTTAGFNSVDMTTVGMPALFIMMVLMSIGGSPASTAGGMKTTALALAILNIRSLVSGRQSIEIFGRRLPEPALQRSFSTILLGFFFIGFFFFSLLLTEQTPPQVLLFEVVSALATVGLSVGNTSELTTAGKLLIILAMFIGRIGFLGFVVALARTKTEGRFDYPHENVLVT